MIVTRSGVIGTVEGTHFSEDLMFKTVFCSTLALVAGSAVMCYADAKADATAAADKLANGANYSWKQTSENAGGGGGFGGGPQSGQTANGVTKITMTFNDMERVTYRKGDKTVMQNQDGEWMTMEEMMAARGGGNGGGQGRGRGRGAGGAQPLPAEMVKDMISKAKDLKDADGGLAGELSEDGAKAALANRGGRRGGGGGNNAGPQNARGTIKVWLKDGNLSKFQSHVTGTVTGRGGDPMDVDRTTTIEFSNVGSTKVDVPEAVAKKLQ